MKNETRVDALRRQVEQERSASKSARVHYSMELRRSILALVKPPKWGFSRVSKALGLAPSVVYRWSKLQGAPRDRARNAQLAASAPKLKQVKIVATADVGARTFELVFPSGAKVTALTWDELSSLVRGNQ
jgi:transposase-like protein